jgi:hypothetical protein
MLDEGEQLAHPWQRWFNDIFAVMRGKSDWTNSGSGLQGVTGYQGVTGSNGLQGIQGVTGYQGIDGVTGMIGLANFIETDTFPPITVEPVFLWNQTDEALFVGVTGIQDWVQIGAGSQGTTGLQGFTGLALGATGIQGLTGILGIDGQTGIQGVTGIYGQTGIQGLTGVIGQTGIQGDTGIQGQTGIQGLTGFYGLTGLYIQGETGIQGFTGIYGLTGIYGQTGIQGQTGFYGLTGIQGITGIGAEPQGWSGTVGTIAKFTGVGITIGNSVLTESDTTITCAGPLNVSGLIQGITVGRGAYAQASNTAYGLDSLKSNVSGTSTTAVGLNSLKLLSSGSSNTAVGSGALERLTTGGSNTAIGYLAGNRSGNNTSSERSIFLGYFTQPSADGNVNETVIGYNMVGGGSNSVSLGNSSVIKTILRGNVGIDSTSPAAKLDIRVPQNDASSFVKFTQTAVGTVGEILSRNNNSYTGGGLSIIGTSTTNDTCVDNITALKLDGVFTDSDPADTVGTVTITGSKSSGSSTLADGETILDVQNWYTSKVKIKGTGTIETAGYIKIGNLTAGTPSDGCGIYFDGTNVIAVKAGGSTSILSGTWS